MLIFESAIGGPVFNAGLHEILLGNKKTHKFQYVLWGFTPTR